MRLLKYIAVFLLGFLIAKFWYERKEEKHQQEEIKVVLNGIQNLSKLVVSEGNFSEMYSFTDTKKYFYNYLSFEKKAMLSVNAKVEVGYDLSKLDIQIDSIAKQIIINKIPEEEIVISPDIKYFDLQQSKFNTFSKAELNKLTDKSIENIKSTITVSNLQKEAKTRLFEELSKLYQLSQIYNWEVVDNTNSKIREAILIKD
ncbi:MULTISPECIES: DUF4230 domain-containing protein [unclassified Tenacibaculum]|uniref:DUF4230 domain-containing protein n=1 Tax=unclassified Tenacibaculum TaxID=2635139 RepID=UPI001F3B11E4|nr:MULTISPECIES: DUF4230 domain-containing protein [unclassified Tenacibaculum]MCF2874452.1 DUF4230 domain-containing protein [Tenacibaculum sp. Cn5-1]MCF2934482.1 DUF4230 domain-containing protein [Tenacibaculum sp. Cn5-34]MCG7510692.1 DUF4230 domain-containing protein [Tenacibaculum sp. Cn5-46]